MSLPILTGGASGLRAGRLCRKEAVREALAEALAVCSLSREEVAQEMTRLTGESVSVNHLNNWCSEAKREWRFPLELATAFCMITGSFGVIMAILDGTGHCLADEETRILAEYGQMIVEERRRASKKRDLLERLGAR